jgi:hypothetical protein
LVKRWTVSRNETLYTYEPFPEPGIGYDERKEVMLMADKGEKEPKATPPKTQCGCGCGCPPVKK